MFDRCRWSILDQLGSTWKVVQVCVREVRRKSSGTFLGRCVRHVYRKGLKTGEDRFHRHSDQKCADLGRRKQGFFGVHLRLEHVCCRFGEQACALVDKTPVIHLESCLAKTLEKAKVLRWICGIYLNAPFHAILCSRLQFNTISSQYPQSNPRPTPDLSFRIGVWLLSVRSSADELNSLQVWCLLIRSRFLFSTACSAGGLWWLEIFCYCSAYTCLFIMPGQIWPLLVTSSSSWLQTTGRRQGAQFYRFDVPSWTHKCDRPCRKHPWGHGACRCGL